MSTTNEEEEQSSAKRLKTGEEEFSIETNRAATNKDNSSSSSTTTTIPSTSLPTTFVTWNCNGLVSRCNWNIPELEQLLRETNFPDVICLQEVRLKASSPHNNNHRGIPLPSDYKDGVQKCMDSTLLFKDYDKHWSLADKRYAGTLTLLHKRLNKQSQGGDPTTSTSAAALAAFTTQSALSLILNKYNLTRKEVGLKEEEEDEDHSTNTTTNDNATTTKKKKPKQQQTSMKSFFAPKASSSTGKHATTPTSTTSHHQQQEHQEEGRFQFFSFPNMDLIQTYVPNNGSKEESYRRRREWDADIKQFLQARQKILNHKASSSSSSSSPKNSRLRPLLWCGDCNCAKEYKDGSHWEERTTSDHNDGVISIYEWWKDESKCYASGQGKNLDPNRHEDDKGLASFTENERRRFLDILQTANLSDVWRELHPHGTTGEGDTRLYKTIWDRPNYTWRGHLSKDGNFPSKYQGKGQRIDYFLLSPSELTQQVVESCDILGYGANRDGLFCGSDHCAHILRLKRPL